jgi:transglutaminase-like putative cysteine protease
MRKSFFLSCAVGLCATLSPTVLCAQFQTPNPDELKMTSDPKAPGAAAVYLDYEETDNDGLHSQIYYARIKVLTEKGKEAATVQIPYWGGEFSIGSVSGRTIHSDGTIVPLTVKPEDLLIQKVNEVEVGHETYAEQVREQRTVFTLPSVEVGSILEYSYQLRFNAQFYWHLDPDWQVQQKYFVHKAHYLFTPSVMLNLLWWPNLPQSAQIITDAAGRYVLDVKDIPAAPEEEWMPPIDSVLYKVHFYYRGALDSMNVDDYWKGEAKDWSKDVDHFAEPTKPIRDAVAGLVAPGDSDLVKAQKLYAAVEALDNTDYSRQVGTSELKQLNQKAASRAEDIWAQKRGNSNDLAQLYLSLLRAAGLTAYATKVVDRDRGVFDASYMSLDQLDSTLVIVNTGGKDVLLDPGEKMCPFGTVNWRHSDAGGLRQSADGPGSAITPAQVFGANTIKRSGEITVDPHGGITGTLQIVMTGQEALAWRQTALEVDAAELKKQFDRGLAKIVPEGTEAHVDHFLGLDDSGSLLMAVVKVTGTIGTATAKRLILPGFYFETKGAEPFVNEETRLEPIDMHYAEQVTEQLTYDLPASVSMEGAPQDTRVSWEGHAVYVVKTKSDPGQLTVARVLARAFDVAKSTDYQDLRGFYQKVAAADQGQLVFTVTAGQTGN